jgi:hypothetical protein
MTPTSDDALFRYVSEVNPLSVFYVFIRAIER